MRTADLSSIPALPMRLFAGQVSTVMEELVLLWLPSQVPGIIGSVVGLVGLVSVL